MKKKVIILLIIFAAAGLTAWYFLFYPKQKAAKDAAAAQALTDAVNAQATPITNANADEINKILTANPGNLTEAEYTQRQQIIFSTR